MAHTFELAKYFSELSYENFPSRVIEKTKKCILDYFGIVLGARQFEDTKKVADFVNSHRQEGRASVIGFGFKTSASMAALANGAFAEILEYQDGYGKGGNHPGSSVLPAALALAESKAQNGKDLIVSLVAGYEVGNRIAASVAPSHSTRGHLPTGTAGAVGAAIAAGKLMGLDPEEMANAMGIAAFLAPISIGENLWGSYNIKILHGGQAARVGTEAAQWAKIGFTGCPLEGSPMRSLGFCNVTSDNPKYEKFTEKLGNTYTILDVYFKPYACCRLTHSAIEATLNIVNEKDIKPAEIESIKVTTYDFAADTVGANYPDGSSNLLRCQFSIPYVIAVAIFDQNVSLEQFTLQKILDPNIIEMSRRVRVLGNVEMNKLYPSARPSQVDIITCDGRKFSKRIDYPLGDRRNPFTDEMFWEKFNHLVSFGSAKQRGDNVKRYVEQLENLSNISILMETLV